jgi:hypothetical protein
MRWCGDEMVGVMLIDEGLDGQVQREGHCTGIRFLLHTALLISVFGRHNSSQDKITKAIRVRMPVVIKRADD